MRTVSAQFQDAVRGSHAVATRVEVLRDGDVTHVIDTVTDGAVTLDQAAATRGRLDCTIIDPDLVPDDPAAALAPYGNELRVYRGVLFPFGGGAEEVTDGGGASSGQSWPITLWGTEVESEDPGPTITIVAIPTEELVSLGIFRIDETTVTDNPDGLEIRVTGMDRSVRMIDARFEQPITVAAGTNVATAIEQLAQDAWPAVETNLTATSLTTPLLVGEEGGDRWKFMQDLAASIGHSLYFDGDGILVSKPVASPNGDLAATFAEGDGGVLLTASRSWTRQGTYNRVIATGENPGEGAVPARGVATDDNPASPTYYYGQYGKVPRFYASQFLATSAQAEDAAQALLNRELGTTQTVTFGVIVNPALEPDDLVTITRNRLGIDETHVIDSITIPLAADQSMSGRTRAVIA